MFLHSDGAKSYRIGINRKDEMPGVVHDYVVHKLKKNKRGTKMRAKYVQLFWHKIEGKTIYTKGGTQIIDRCWRHIREHVGSRSSATSGEERLDARVRSAQWTYWHRNQDHWLETGKMLRSLT